MVPESWSENTSTTIGAEHHSLLLVLLPVVVLAFEEDRIGDDSCGPRRDADEFLLATHTLLLSRVCLDALTLTTSDLRWLHMTS